MARDYKPKRKKTGGFSGWLGLACGLGLGLAAAGVIYLKDRRIDAPYAAAVKGQAGAKKKLHANDPPEDTGTDESGKTYDFYDMLPKFEVVVPEKDKNVHHDIKSVPVTRRGTYVLQAGSYKNDADAQRSRAKLALQGIESKVQRVSVDQETWYRIRVGPVSNLDDLNRLRAILHKAEVDVLLVQVGD